MGSAASAASGGNREVVTASGGTVHAAGPKAGRTVCGFQIYADYRRHGFSWIPEGHTRCRKCFRNLKY